MRTRLVWLDAVRGLAVAAMIVFHLIWDLAHFGYISRTIPWSAPVKAFGHSIAFSFLFIAGYSLALAHRDHIKWPAFWRRIAIVAGAAALVSAGTYAVFPNAWVFFGILHVIAAASLAAPPFLNAPWIVTLGAGLLALAAPYFAASPVFDHDWLSWTGLGTLEPRTQDWRPFFPWAGALLLGLAAARLLLPGHGTRNQASAVHRTSGERGLAFLGRHSLLIYLAHQPALFALFTALAFVAPPQEESAEFIGACEKQCVASGGAQQKCREACQCLSDEVARKNGLAGAKNEAERDAQLEKLTRKCAGR